MKEDSDGHSARRFLFSVAGGYGHFHPLVPLARALKQAGHEVAFAVGASLRPMAEAAGFRVFQVGGNFKGDAEYEQFKVEQATMPLALESELTIYTRLWCGITPRLRTPQLVDIAHRWHPDMFIRESAEYGAAIAAERLGLPHAAVSVMASLKAQMIFEREAAEQLDPIRKSWGLEPDPTLTSLYRYLYLCYSPPSFSVQDIGGWEAPGLMPPIIHHIRPQLFDNTGDESLPGWMEQLPQQPTVYVTLGTEVNKEPGVYPDVLQTIVEGLRDLPLNLIVTVGRDNDPSDLGPQPANVHIERYIPQSLLLRECDLMVMHAGSNSLLAALDARLPMVLIPLIADQFFNSEVAERLGLAQTVQLGQLTPSTIRAAAEEVLGNPIYRQNVARLQAEMHALPDDEYAVALIEGILTGYAG